MVGLKLELRDVLYIIEVYYQPSVKTFNLDDNLSICFYI